MVLFRRVWSDRQERLDKRSLRPGPDAISGRSDRRLLLALASATEAMATHCDLLVDRLTAQEAVTADVAAPSARRSRSCGRRSSICSAAWPRCDEAES